MLALLLVRRKRFRLDGTTREDDREELQLRCLKTGTKYRVVDPDLSDDELATVQDDVFRAMGWV